jgi:hypothetical protein
MCTPTNETTATLLAGLLPFPPRRELARRVNGGIEVALYWSPEDNSTSVEVREAASPETLHFEVAPARALEAFYHPFAELPTTYGEVVAPVEA